VTTTVGINGLIGLILPPGDHDGGDQRVDRPDLAARGWTPAAIVVQPSQLAEIVNCQ
jgi:hypothetical protein